MRRKVIEYLGKNKEKKTREEKKWTEEEIKEIFKKNIEEGLEEIRKDYFLNYYLKRTEVHKVVGNLNGMISKEKTTNEMEEIRKIVVATINTIKEVVGRKNKEKRKRKTKKERKLLALERAMEKNDIEKMKRILRTKGGIEKMKKKARRKNRNNEITNGNRK